MEPQYNARFADAYRRGYELKYAGVENPPELKMHYFKTKEELPRLQVILGFLQGIVPAGQCNSLLDVGCGRGVFLFPLIREFPDLKVTSVDILPHRVDLLDCISKGGVENLHPMLADICDGTLPDKSFDVVTMLEVLEHIPDTEKAVRNAVRLARNHIYGCLVSVMCNTGAGIVVTYEYEGKRVTDSAVEFSIWNDDGKALSDSHDSVADAKLEYREDNYCNYIELKPL